MIKKTNRKRASPYHRADYLWAFLFIAPQMIGIIIFYLWPMVYSAFASFTNWDGLTPPSFVGLENYARVFTNSKSLKEIKNTIVYTLATVPICLFLSVMLANTLNKKMRFKGIFRVIYFLPSVTMPVATAVVWRWVLNSKYGLVNDILGRLGLHGPGWIVDPKLIMLSLVVVTIWAQIGYNMIILLAGLQGISKQYYEAADVEGANDNAKFFSITLPLLSPTLFFLTTLMIMNAFKAFDIIYVFSGASSQLSGGQLLDAIRTMVFGIYENGFSFMRMGYASAQSMVLFIIITVVTLIQFKLQDKWVYYE